MTTLAEIEAAATTLKPDEREHLETVLRELRENEKDAYLQSLYERTGVFPLPKQPDDKPVTNEMIRQISDDEDFERYRLSQSHSVLEIPPLSVGTILQPLSPGDDLLGEMLEDRL